ncbi:MAG: aminotransferase class I/II-fold pyridoxal phosphate-dependent enzyme [Sphingomonadaceae bacterium]|nr:aminotransferase class I/II-fold pyridoxal phosphate-dependent enzyme [Sphingomonadaceae bacterium]
MKRRSGLDREQTAAWGPNTRAVRGGTARTGHGETAEAIFLTSGFAYESAGEAAGRFDGSLTGPTYSRLQNPTVAMLEERLALMEGAEACRTMASGMAAMTSAVLSHLSAGDHAVAAATMFGSCRWLFDQLLPRFGIATTIVPGPDPAEWRAAIKPNTRLFFLETPANPTLHLIPISEVAAIAHEAGAILICDNAITGPTVQRPLEHGADIVCYSLTKSMDGQGRVMAGAVLGCREWIEGTLLPFTRNTGPTLSPFAAWVVLNGLTTLDLRMGRACATAASLAATLEGRGVCVTYPGLGSHPQHALAAAQMRSGGALIALWLDGREQAFRFLDALTIIDISNNLGDARSMITHPFTTTHTGVGADTRRAMGITEGLLRFSVGLEDEADLAADLVRAADAAGL